MILREERPDDASAIEAVTAAAFEGHPFSRGTEPAIVRALREAGALALSLVAEIDGRVVGHVAFSPVETTDGARGWMGAGPLSVAPALQRRGIGSALMREGLARLAARGAAGCALVGDPAFYRRFGFSNPAGLVHEGVPPEVFQTLALRGPVPRGTIRFHPAFEVEP